MAEPPLHPSSAPQFTAIDPHHDGGYQWGWVDGKLYHRASGEQSWTRVNRVSVTAARVRVLAALLAAEEQARGGPVPEVSR